MWTFDKMERRQDEPRTSTPGGSQSSKGILVRHFFEMLAAMIAGMFVLGALGSLVTALLGYSGIFESAYLLALLMPTSMAAGMSLWMWHRGHAWPLIWEMAAVMYVPFLALIPLFSAGVISEGTLQGAAHALMLPAMAGVMLLRREHYSQDHGQHAAAASPVR